MYDDPELLPGRQPDRPVLDRRPQPRPEQGADGSITIYLQALAGPEQEANWLPTPAGNFRPVLRSYQPGQAILDGTYVLPPVRKVG